MPTKEEHIGERRGGHSILGQFGYPGLVAVLYNVADISAVAGAAIAANLIISTDPLASAVRLTILVALLLTHVIFSRLGLYDSWRGRSIVEQAGRLVAGWLAVMASVITIGFLLDITTAFDRGWLVLWLVLGAAFLVLARSAAVLGLRFVRTRGWNRKRVVIVGGGTWAATVIRRLNNASWLGLDVVMVLDDDRRCHGEAIDGAPIQGGYELLPQLIQQEQVEEVWICLPITSGRPGESDALDRVMGLLRHSTITQRLVPNLTEMRLMNRPMTQITDLSVVSLNVSPMRIGMNRVLKAIEDRLVALAIVVLMSPVMLMIWAAVRLTSPGPAIFKQVRHGWDGHPIKIYKFRTMHVHSEGNGEVTQASRDDGRVTRVGRFLRRTSLDELPQFFNVLQGRMSVVGPRPHAVEHNRYFMDQIDDYMQRHKVKPGITGWAQVNGLRGETDALEKMKKRVQFDLYYIENWSLWFDIKITLLTVIRGFFHPNAF